MLAYIMQFAISFVFIKGSRNCLADALSRMYQDSSKQERLDNTARYMYEVGDFILPVMHGMVKSTSLIESPMKAQSGERRKSTEAMAITTRSTRKQEASSTDVADSPKHGLTL